MLLLHTGILPGTGMKYSNLVYLTLREVASFEASVSGSCPFRYVESQGSGKPILNLPGWLEA